MRSARVRPTRRRDLGSWRRRSPTTAGRRRPSGSTRPGSPTACSPGTRLLLTGKLDRGPASGWPTHEVLVRGRPRRRNPHDRDRARPSRHRGAAREAASRVGLAGHAAGDRRDRAAAGGAARPPRPGAARPTRSIAAHFPDRLVEAEQARHRLAFEELFLHQARSRRAATSAGDRQREAIAPTARASWSRSVGSPRCRSSSTGDQRARSSEIDADLGARAADAAPADGGGGIGQDGRSRSTRCCARSRRAARRR